MMTNVVVLQRFKGILLIVWVIRVTEVDLILQGKRAINSSTMWRWKQSVRDNTVLRLKAGKQVHGCYDAWIGTTSNFT